MMVELFIAAIALAIGIAFAATGAQFCSHGCWLNDFLDSLLPEKFESMGGGLPWLAVGTMLAASVLARRRK